MKRFYFFIIFFILMINLFVQIPELNIWNNIRNSSYTQEDQIHIRCETIDLPMIQTDMFYLWEDEWIQIEMDNLAGLTVEGVINGSHQEDMYCRFKTSGDTLVGMMPAYVPEDVFPPDIARLSLIASDAVGDTIQGGPEHLDLLGTYFGYSDTRFYLAFQNNGTGFPTDEGGWFPSEFYAYMVGLVNPENVLVDTAGYGLVYVQVPLFFQPGLYRFAGTELSLDNLQQIAEIETAVVDDILFIACDIDDLINDEFFGDWPSFSRALGIDFITASFSISLVDSLQLDYALVDMSVPSVQVIDQYVIEPFNNTLPVISDISAEIEGASTTLELTYQDDDNNFPLLAQVITDQNDTYEMLPDSLDFSQPVTFSAEIPFTDWEYLSLFFSDNGFEFVEEIIYNTTAGDQIVKSEISMSVFPNPFNPTTTISFYLNRDITGKAEVEIFNIKGQQIKNYSILPEQLLPSYGSGNNQFSIIWNGTDNLNQPVPSGVYFCKLKYGSETVSRKMVLLK